MDDLIREARMLMSDARQHIPDSAEGERLYDELGAFIEKTRDIAFPPRSGPPTGLRAAGQALRELVASHTAEAQAWDALTRDGATADALPTIDEITGILADCQVCRTTPCACPPHSTEQRGEG